MSESDPLVSDIQLRTYYERKFPFDKIKDWINYGGEEPIENRECAFFFDDENFYRWSLIDRMQAILMNPMNQAPARMEIGPVYNMPLQQKNQPGFRAFHRELVFDIDADDFKDIKCCCGDSEICPKCWKFMACALKCLSTILRKNFGFKNILLVFSGRRGVHIWVCDKKARELGSDIRKAIVTYLNLNLNTNNPHFRISSCPLAQQMIHICEDYFPAIASEQSIFTNSKILPKIDEIFIRDKDKKDKIIDIWTGKDSRSKGKSPEEKFEIMKKEKFGIKTFETMELYYQLIYTFTFPRLDANVTTGLNHLLKSPFSVHPKSALISLPIPEKRINVFPHEWVPKIDDLIADEPDALSSFEDAIQYFSEFVDGSKE